MSNYHGWTHAPKAQGGTDPIPPSGGEQPYAIIVWDDGATIADDTLTTLASLTNFSLGYVSDASKMTVVLSTGRVILDSVEGPGASTTGGVWLAHLHILFVDNFDGDMWCDIVWPTATVELIQTVTSYAKAQGVANPMTTGETLLGTSVMTVLEGNSGFNHVTGQFKQVSGSSQDISEIVLKLQRLATYPAASGVDFP